MKQNYNNPMILRAYNILEILSEDEEARRIAEIREKALKDERSITSEIERKATEKSKREMARKLLNLGVLTKEQIAEVTELSVQEIEKLY